ncbi:MAG: nicotinamide riboside transporter PnuC [bacterium]|nr:nicotinamide riboside transporter PnuC [bacterium]
MNIIKLDIIMNREKVFFAILITILAINYFVFKDNLASVLSAFWGVSYAFLAGKGKPSCYLFGLSGSGLYGWLSFANAFWGNLVLYLFYYIPMQILGFFKWNNNLKNGKKEIIKTCLSHKEKLTLSILITITTIIFGIALYYMHDKNPLFDSITTIGSIAGMYLTVKRCIEQWLIWIIVDSLSALMWLEIALNGEKVYSTVIMWCLYTFLAVYFYIHWKKEIKENSL